MKGIAWQDENSLAEVTKKLVEYRLYLEKGVRPLESRLKYQIDKVLRATETAQRPTVQKSRQTTEWTNGKRTSDEEGNSENSANDNEDADDIDELSYQPNPAAFSRPFGQKAETRPHQNQDDEDKPGIYKPPRITPTALPSTFSDRRGPSQRRPQRSEAVDDYINTELSSAPMAEPSIGSTIARSGRGSKSAKEREKEAERRAYEESNLVRLPKEGKKDRDRANRGRESGFGGEEFRNLGVGLDRIERLTGKRKERFTEDGPRGEGYNPARVRKKRKMGRR